jgi:chitin disaccharide deacetylase
MTFPRWTRAVVSLVASLPAWLQAADAPSLVERLGYPAGSRVLIINGDDSGMCHTANLATIEAMEKGLMTSSTIMVPCPWFLEIANYAKAHPERDFGLHLVQTSEWRVYRWGPVAPRNEVPGLIDPEGYLWHEVPQVYAKAKPEEAYIESRAQIRKALDAGVDVTHLDSHMGTLQLNPAYVEQYLKLAVEFDLPVRMASQETLEKFGGGGQRVAFAARGIVFPDDFVYEDLKDMPKDPNGYWKRKLASLKPGVTELYIHAGKPTDELKAITNSWKTRSEEFETFTNDPEVRAILEREKVIRIGWRPLRELQRKDRKGS